MQRQQVRRSRLQGARVVRADQDETTRHGNCRSDASRNATQQPQHLPRHSLARFSQHHIRADQRLQMFADEGVVRAAQRQRVDVPGLSAKQAHSPRITCAYSYEFCSVFSTCAAFYGVCQAVAGLQNELGDACLRGQQCLKARAGQGAARRHHADAAGLA